MTYNIFKEIIEKASIDLAKKHCQIIEHEFNNIMEKYNVLEQDLVVEYHPSCVIKIKIMPSEFKVENVYTFKSDGNGAVTETIKTALQRDNGENTKISIRSACRK